MTMLQKAGIAAGVMETSADLLQDPQLTFRERFWLMEHPEIGPFYHLGQPSVLSETPAKARIPVATFSQHTEYVCREIMGISDEEFVTLLADGLFE